MRYGKLFSYFIFKLENQNVLDNAHVTNNIFILNSKPRKELYN